MYLPWKKKNDLSISTKYKLPRAALNSHLLQDTRVRWKSYKCILKILFDLTACVQCHPFEFLGERIMRELIETQEDRSSANLRLNRWIYRMKVVNVDGCEACLGNVSERSSLRNLVTTSCSEWDNGSLPWGALTIRATRAKPQLTLAEKGHVGHEYSSHLFLSLSFYSSLSMDLLSWFLWFFLSHYSRFVNSFRILRPALAGDSLRVGNFGRGKLAAEQTSEMYLLGKYPSLVLLFKYLLRILL